MKRRGQDLDQALAVHGVADVRIVDPAREDRRQRRLELAQLLGLEHIEAHAAAALEVQQGLGVRQPPLGLIDREPAGSAQQVPGVRQGEQPVEGLEGALEQGLERDRDLLDPVAPARRHEAQQPGRKARQVGPAQRQRPERVEQQARYLAQNARRGHRHDRLLADHRAVAEGGARARAFALDERDLKAVALQAQRRTHPDDAGADHRDPAARVLTPWGHAGTAGKRSAKRRRAAGRSRWCGAKTWRSRKNPVSARPCSTCSVPPPPWPARNPGNASSLSR